MGLLVSKFKSHHRQSPLCGSESPQVTIRRTCPSMTLAVKWDIKPNFDFEI